MKYFILTLLAIISFHLEIHAQKSTLVNRTVASNDSTGPLSLEALTNNMNNGDEIEIQIIGKYDYGSESLESFKIQKQNDISRLSIQYYKGKVTLDTVLSINDGRLMMLHHCVYIITDGRACCNQLVISGTEYRYMIKYNRQLLRKGSFNCDYSIYEQVIKM